MRKRLKRNHCEILVSKPRRFTPKIARNCRRRENLINFEEKSIIEATALKHRYRNHSIVEYENELNLKFFHFETKFVYLPSLTDAVLITVSAYWYRSQEEEGPSPHQNSKEFAEGARTLRLRINALRETRKTAHCNWLCLVLETKGRREEKWRALDSPVLIWEFKLTRHKRAVLAFEETS